MKTPKLVVQNTLFSELVVQAACHTVRLGDGYPLYLARTGTKPAMKLWICPQQYSLQTAPRGWNQTRMRGSAAITACPEVAEPGRTTGARSGLCPAAAVRVSSRRHWNTRLTLLCHRVQSRPAWSSPRWEDPWHGTVLFTPSSLSLSDENFNH